MKKIQAIFFDIDGTLMTEKQTIPDSTYQALKILKRKGIKLFIATGRPKNDLIDFQKKLPIEFDGWVIMNGQYCYSGNRIIRESYIPKQELEIALQYLKEQNIGTFIAEAENLFINLNNENLTPEFLEMISTRPVKIYDIQRAQTHKVYQLMAHIYESKTEVEKNFFDILKSCKGARWNFSSTDVIPKDGGKNKGIDAMLAYFHIPLENTMAFGDGDNDIDMLKHVGLGVAMGNAHDHVKKIADYVTSTIDDDGIYQACKYFKMI